MWRTSARTAGFDPEWAAFQPSVSSSSTRMPAALPPFPGGALFLMLVFTLLLFGGVPASLLLWFCLAVMCVATCLRLTLSEQLMDAAAQTPRGLAWSLLAGTPAQQQQLSSSPSSAAMVLLPPSHPGLLHLTLMDRDWLAAGGSFLFGSAAGRSSRLTQEDLAQLHTHVHDFSCKHCGLGSPPAPAPPAPRFGSSGGGSIGSKAGLAASSSRSISQGGSSQPMLSGGSSSSSGWSSRQLDESFLQQQQQQSQSLATQQVSFGTAAGVAAATPQGQYGWYPQHCTSHGYAASGRATAAAANSTNSVSSNSYGQAWPSEALQQQGAGQQLQLLPAIGAAYTAAVMGADAFASNMFNGSHQFDRSNSSSSSLAGMASTIPTTAASQGALSASGSSSSIGPGAGAAGGGGSAAIAAVASTPAAAANPAFVHNMGLADPAATAAAIAATPATQPPAAASGAVAGSGGGHQPHRHHHRHRGHLQQHQHPFLAPSAFHQSLLEAWGSCGSLDGLDGDEESSSQLCSICLGSFRAGCNVTRLPCGHCYHKECILPWLLQQGRGATCPMCKAQVFH